MKSWLHKNGERNMQASCNLISIKSPVTEKSYKHFKIERAVLPPGFIYFLFNTYLSTILLKEERKRLEDVQKTREREVCIIASKVFKIDNGIW